MGVSPIGIRFRFHLPTNSHAGPSYPCQRHYFTRRIPFYFLFIFFSAAVATAINETNEGRFFLCVARRK